MFNERCEAYGVLSPSGVACLELRHVSRALCWEGALTCCTSAHAVFDCRGLLFSQKFP